MCRVICAPELSRDDEYTACTGIECHCAWLRARLRGVREEDLRSGSGWYRLYPDTESYVPVSGGTGWAVQMAIDSNKPVYLFDQESGKWFSFSGADNNKFGWTELETAPVLTKNFAGIGTRDINEAGRRVVGLLSDGNDHAVAAVVERDAGAPALVRQVLGDRHLGGAVGHGVDLDPGTARSGRHFDARQRIGDGERERLRRAGGAAVDPGRRDGDRGGGRGLRDGHVHVSQTGVAAVTDLDSGASGLARLVLIDVEGRNAVHRPASDPARRIQIQQ